MRGDLHMGAHVQVHSWLCGNAQWLRHNGHNTTASAACGRAIIQYSLGGWLQMPLWICVDIMLTLC
jgi:hypothetical protein